MLVPVINYVLLGQITGVLVMFFGSVWSIKKALSLF